MSIGACQTFWSPISWNPWFSCFDALDLQGDDDDYGDFFNVMNINEMLMMLMIVMVNGVRQLGASLIEKIESSRSLAWQQQQNDDHDHIIRITVKGEAILKQKETEAERGEVCL